jgi:nucleoid-associated protein YgaU
MPAQRRNAVLSLIVAAILVVVVLFVVAGPQLFNRIAPDTETAPEAPVVADQQPAGDSPPPDASEAADAPAVAADAETAGPIPEPAPEPEVVADLPQAPELSLIRAEPDGTVVIAGVGTPGEDVSVFANGALLGTATPEDSGDWELAPAAPLAAGGTAITVGSAPDAVDERSFVVVVDPAKTVGAEVIETTAAEADAVIAALPAPSARAMDVAAPATETADTSVADEESLLAARDAAARDVEVALAAPVEIVPPTVPADAPAIAVSPTTEGAAAGAARDLAVRNVEVALASPLQVAAPRGTQGQPAADSTADGGARELAANDVNVALAAPVAVAPPALPPSPAAQPAATNVAAGAGAHDVQVALAAPVEVAPPIPSAPAPTAAATQVAPPAPASPPAGTREDDLPIALAPPPASALPAPAVAVPAAPQEDTLAAAAPPVGLPPAAPDIGPPIPPVIDAIEIDGSENYFAGTGEEGATVRIFVDDTFAGEALVADGYWLVEAQGVLTGPQQRVRAEMSSPGRDLQTAEVDFVVDLPPALDAHAPVAAPPPTAAISAAAGPRPVTPPPVPPMARAAPDPQELPPPVPDMTAAQATGPLRAAAEASDVAARDVEVALAAPVTIAATAPGRALSAPAAEPAKSAGEIAARDVEAALGSPLVIAPPAVPVTQPLVEAPAATASEAAAELAARSVNQALAAPIDVAAAPPAAPSELAADPGAAADLAVRDVGAALAAPVELAAVPAREVPAEQQAPSAAAAELAARDVTVALAAPLAITHPAPGPAAPATPEPPAAEPSPAEVAEVPGAPAAEPEVPVIRAVPQGDADAARFSDGRVIIRRGDTLWDIAERVYGEGWRYPRIFRANRDKIRRPGRIYPGQVFELPLP